MHSFGGEPGLPLMTHLWAHLSLSLLIRRQNPLACLPRHMFNAISVAVSTNVALFHRPYAHRWSPHLKDRVLGESFDLIF